MQFDLLRETVIRWSDPDPRHVALLREGGITVVMAARNESFENACRAAGIRVIPEEQVQTLGLHEVGKAKPGRTEELPLFEEDEHLSDIQVERQAPESQRD